MKAIHMAKMNDQKSSTSSHRQIVFCLLGLTVGYQMLYQGIMMHTVQKNAAVDEECASTYTAAQSPRCLEVNLFRSWQQEEQAFDNLKLRDIRRGAGGEAVPLAAPVKLKNNASGIVIYDATAVPRSRDPSTSQPLVAAAGKASRGHAIFVTPQPSASQDSKDKVPAKTTTRFWSPMTEWAANLVGLQRRMQAKSDDLERRHRELEKQHAEHEAKFRQLELNRLERDVRESINQSRDTMGPLAKDLIETQKHLEAQLQHLHLMHEHVLRGHLDLHRNHEVELDRLEKQVLESLNSSRNTVSPWEKDLIASQKHLEAESQHLEWSKAHAHRMLEIGRLEREVRESLNRSRGQISPWAQDLMEAQKRLEDQARHLNSRLLHGHEELLRNATDLSSHVELNVTHAERQALRKAREKERSTFKKEAAEHKAKLEARLADLAAARKLWETELLGAGMHRPELRSKAKLDPSPPPGLLPPASPALRGTLYKSLSWPAVREWPRSNTGHKGSLLAAGLKELRAARWSGMIPKVACISVIPSGHTAKARMSHFIENFRLQEYEGSTQLVLVYHHLDEEAKKLVDTYADGSNIKSAAAFGDRKLQSPVAFRYGAWVSDADIVARWDFEEFHHPWRLSLQIRALALTSRPASFFRQAAAANSKDQPALVASSVLGERAWMHEYWHPFMSTESMLLEGSHAGQGVEVDVLELRRSARPSDTLQASSRLPSACFESEKVPDSQQPLEKVITETLGSTMATSYHALLAKREDVEEKLMDFCAEEAANTHDEDSFRREQLRRLADARTDMEVHLGALTALFTQAA